MTFSPYIYCAYTHALMCACLCAYIDYLTYVFNIDFPLVHKLDQAANVIEFAIFHYNYGIFVGVSIRQYGIEKCAART